LIYQQTKANREQSNSSHSLQTSHHISTVTKDVFVQWENF